MLAALASAWARTDATGARGSPHKAAQSAELVLQIELGHLLVRVDLQPKRLSFTASSNLVGSRHRDPFSMKFMMPP